MTEPTRRAGLPRAAATEAPAPASAPAPEPPAPRHTAVKRWVLLSTGLLMLGAVVILVARGLLTLPAVRAFVETYPGHAALPEGSPVGIPAWLSWTHFLNAFFLVLIVKTGWQVRTQRRPPAMWRSRRDGAKPLSITLWLHLSLDLLWLVNGLAFVVLLFATGHWVRIVPTSWEIVPNAASAALQYASLDWPTENGWVNYNSLQVLAYFVTVFVAAPLAAITGARMSPIWPSAWTRVNRVYPIEVARAIHFPVMLYFTLFVVAHVTLVLATGALRNLNHMYGGQDAVNGVGAVIFAVSLVVIAAAWVAARPVVVASVARAFGTVSR